MLNSSFKLSGAWRGGLGRECRERVCREQGTPLALPRPGTPRLIRRAPRAVHLRTPTAQHLARTVTWHLSAPASRTAGPTLPFILAPHPRAPRPPSPAVSSRVRGLGASPRALSALPAPHSSSYLHPPNAALTEYPRVRGLGAFPRALPAPPAQRCTSYLHPPNAALSLNTREYGDSAPSRARSPHRPRCAPPRTAPPREGAGRGRWLRTRLAARELGRHANWGDMRRK
ncbi:hypothetical protein DFH09DRAFT_1492677 [Mycena vulgaris]|nr:hypothetical protein DFH09DRAFT_1492677 [Mycena vulgaris]